MAARVRVDDSGIYLEEFLEEPVDVRFGGHRLWSFNAARDGTPSGRGRQVPWPGPIRARLDGVAQVTVEPHLGGNVLYDEFTRFGRSTEPLAFVDDLGNPLTFDKGGHFQRSFDRMDDESLTALTMASRRVLDDLVDECGLDAYLCYGGLLGAVRNGKMIGHDSDVDLAWISAYTHPFDIIRESRAAERKMRDLGWKVVRMSAANFKVWADLPNGKRAGVDVFGSFHIGDHFHLTGSLRGELDRDKILPFAPITLEGVEFPAPRDLDAFLTYTYGPGWKVPDPAFHFDHPPENTAMMSHWVRGSRRRLWYWSAFYTSPDLKKVPTEPSLFAPWVAERIEPRCAHHRARLGDGSGRDLVRPAGFPRAGQRLRGCRTHRRDQADQGRRREGPRPGHQPGVGRQLPPPGRAARRTSRRPSTSTRACWSTRWRRPRATACGGSARCSDARADTPSWSSGRPTTGADRSSSAPTSARSPTWTSSRERSRRTAVRSSRS